MDKEPENFLDAQEYMVPDSVEFTDAEGSSLERYNLGEKIARQARMPHGHISSIGVGFALLPHDPEMTKALGGDIFAFLHFGINGEKLPIAFVEDVEHMKIWVNELKDQLDNFDPDAVQWGPEGMSA